MKHLFLFLFLTAACGCMWSCNSGKDEPPGPAEVTPVVVIEAPFDLTGYNAVFAYTPGTKALTAAIPVVVDGSNPLRGTCTLPTLSSQSVLTSLELTHPEHEAYTFAISGGQQVAGNLTVTAYDKENSANASDAQRFTAKMQALQESPVLEQFIVFGNMSDAQLSQLHLVIHKFRVLMLPDQLNLDWMNFTSVLTRVVAPKAVSVADACFEGCDALVTLEAPNLTSIGGAAFRGTPIRIIEGKKLIRVGQEAFAGCTALTSIDLSGAEEIGIGAFALCEKLASVGSLGKAKNIGDGAFRECPVLQLDGKFDRLETLGLGAFDKCLGLKQVDAPLLKEIESNAFAFCPITTVKLPAVEKVGRMAFGETAIQTLSLPACVESQDGFQDMSQLKTLDLPAIRKFTDVNNWGTTTLSVLKLGYQGRIEWPYSTGRIRLTDPEHCALYLDPVNIPSSGSTFWGGHTWKSISAYSAE